MGDGEGWLCEPEDAPRESWMSDAFWRKASDRYGHRSLVRTREGIGYVFDPMAWVKSTDRIRQLFYGDAGAADEISGLACRYCTRDRTLAQNAVCVLDAGGRGKWLTSAWIVVWGPHSVFMVTVDGAPPVAGGEMGLALKDWRYVYRIANVPPDIDFVDLEGLLIRAMVALPLNWGRPNLASEYRPVIYMHEHVARRLPRERVRDVYVRSLPLRCDEACVEGGAGEHAA